MTKLEHTKMHGTLCGRFSKADKTGVYAVDDTGEERLIGYWQRPRCVQAPEIKSITREQDCYVLKMADIGGDLYLSA